MNNNTQQELTRFEQSFDNEGMLKSPIWIKDQRGLYSGYITVAHANDEAQMHTFTLHSVDKKVLAQGNDLRALMAETIKKHRDTLMKAADKRRALKKSMEGQTQENKQPSKGR